MKSVLVTGGTIRLGRIIAERLRATGWRVLTTSHRPEAGADIVADFADPMGPAKAYAAALQQLNGLPPDALVNNAALFAGEAALVERINHVAAQKLTMMMAGRETGRGAVVNILDCRVLNAVEPETAYEKSKRALLEDTRKYARLFAETLRVNAVAPGAVLPSAAVHEKAGETLVGLPTPEDVAEAVVFLLETVSIDGCVLPVDGGQHLL